MPLCNLSVVSYLFIWCDFYLFFYFHCRAGVEVIRIRGSEDRPGRKPQEKHRRQVNVVDQEFASHAEGQRLWGWGLLEDKIFSWRKQSKHERTELGQHVTLIYHPVLMSAELSPAQRHIGRPLERFNPRLKQFKKEKWNNSFLILFQTLIQFKQ